MWGSSELKKKMHLVRWDMVTRRKDMEGFGIRKSRDMNDAMLIKWWWRFGMERNSLWKRILFGKYNLHMNAWNPKVETV